MCNTLYDRDESIVLYKLRGATRKALAIYYQTIGVVLPGSVLGQLGIQSNVSSMATMFFVIVLLLVALFWRNKII